MYNRHLKFFIQTADCGSFSKAARKLYISPNAVIKQINSFEDHLGFPLFIRSNHGLELTEDGRTIYTEGKKIIRRSDRILEEIRRKKEDPCHIVRIGTSLLFPSRSISGLWASVQNNYPGIRLSSVPFVDSRDHYFEYTDPIWEEVDVALAHFTHHRREQGVERLKIQDRPICVSLPYRHPLAGKKILEPEDLDGQTIIIVEEGLSDYIDLARAELVRRCPNLTIIDSPAYDMDRFDRCVADNCLMISVAEWADVHPSITTVPVNWSYTLPYGIMYRENPSPDVSTFIKAIGAALEKQERQARQRQSE